MQLVKHPTRPAERTIYSPTPQPPENDSASSDALDDDTLNVLVEAYRAQVVATMYPEGFEQLAESWLIDYCLEAGISEFEDELHRHSLRNVAISEHLRRWRIEQRAFVDITPDILQMLISQYRASQVVQSRRQAYWQEIFQPAAKPIPSAEWYYDACGRLMDVDEDNRYVVQALCLYFARDPRFESIGVEDGFDGFGGGFSLEKGILLFGPVGCGKSHLMKLFQSNPALPYTDVTCRAIASAYKSEGDGAILKYTRLQLSKNAGWCFEDLGTERQKKHYGDELNVMADVLQDGYDEGVLIGRMHLTTNLDGEDIEERYGLRLRSRFREMFNLITFPENARDRRA